MTRGRDAMPAAPSWRDGDRKPGVYVLGKTVVLLGWTDKGPRVMGVADDGVLVEGDPLTGAWPLAPFADCIRDAFSADMLRDASDGDLLAEVRRRGLTMEGA